MKKINIFLILFTFCFTSLFADDFMVGLGGPSFSFYDSSYVSIIAETHNYFGENKKIGIETALFMFPVNGDMRPIFQKFSGSFYAGPCAKFRLFRSSEFILSAGFRYSFDWYKEVENLDYPENDHLKIIDNYFCHGFAAAIDIQFKLWANNKSSVAFGLPFSIGKYQPIYTQRPVAENPNAHYRKLKSNYDMIKFMSFEMPYILYCYNF